LAEPIGLASCGTDSSQTFTSKNESVVSLSLTPDSSDGGIETELHRTILAVSGISLRPADLVYAFQGQSLTGWKLGNLTYILLSIWYEMSGTDLCSLGPDSAFPTDMSVE
jgi:hypothetical protein